jgi:hypothetical protein
VTAVYTPTRPARCGSTRPAIGYVARKALAPDETRYRELPPDGVLPDVRAVGERVLADVKAHLGLPGLRLHWFCEMDGWDYEDEAACLARREFAPFKTWVERKRFGKGFFDRSAPDDIWVKVRRDPWEVARTVAHEACHAHQHRGRRYSTNVEAAEMDAQGYAAEVIYWYKTNGGLPGVLGRWAA